MINLSIQEILRATGGRLIQGKEDTCIHGVSTDSRAVKKGELFFALKGPRFDGHAFIGDVFKKGARCAIVAAELRIRNPEFSIIKVTDTITALGDLAHYWRKLHPVPLIAVSGSCGKTTTKEMIASVLKASRPILKTEGNLNNLIGLPLTLFGLNNIHKAAVVELGVSEKGEMKRLTHICKPNIAVLTNIGEAHTATLGSIDEVASAKGELFQGIGSRGTAVINIDDPYLFKMADGVGARKITFSLKTKADVMLKNYSIDDAKGMSGTFLAMGKEIPVKLKYTGMHNLSNAAAAIATALPLGATKDEIIDGLNSTEPIHARMEIIALRNEIIIIDDTYNANPLSMEVSLKTLANMTPLSGAKGRKIAVLGDMLELGDISKHAHRRIGKLAKDLGIDMLFTVGDFRKDYVTGAREAGMPSQRTHATKNKHELVNMLREMIQEGDAVLVKGSRAMEMEEVVKQIILQNEDCKMQKSK